FIMVVVILSLCAGIIGILIHIRNGTVEAKRVLFVDSRGRVLAELGVCERQDTKKQKFEWPELRFFDDKGRLDMRLTEGGVLFLDDGREVSVGDGYIENSKLGMSYGLHVLSGN